MEKFRFVCPTDVYTDVGFRLSSSVLDGKVPLT